MSSWFARWSSWITGLVVTGCSRTEPAAPPPELYAAAANGFCDLNFALRRRSRDADRAERLEAVAHSRGKEVALDVRLGAEWKSGRIGNADLVSYSGVVELCSKGAASDALVQAMADAYGVSVAPA